jgi:hypothetical protein
MTEEAGENPPAEADKAEMPTMGLAGGMKKPKSSIGVHIP